MGLLLASLLLLPGCELGITAPEGLALQLNGGEEVLIEGTILRVGFHRVLEDSRCPQEVVCVWAGNVQVEVGNTFGKGPTYPVLLNSAIPPREAVRNGIRVRLVDVEPDPVAGMEIPFESYRITLRLAQAD